MKQSAIALPEEVPEALPESREARQLLDLTEAIYTTPGVEGVRSVWARLLEGQTLPQALGHPGGRRVLSEMYQGLRDRYLALAYALVVGEGQSYAQGCKALLEALRRFEAGRYRVWQTKGMPPDARKLEACLYRALIAMDTYPRTVRGMQQAVSRGKTCLLSDSTP